MSLVHMLSLLLACSSGAQQPPPAAAPVHLRSPDSAAPTPQPAAPERISCNLSEDEVDLFVEVTDTAFRVRDTAGMLMDAADAAELDSRLREYRRLAPRLLDVFVLVETDDAARVTTANRVASDVGLSPHVCNELVAAGEETLDVISQDGYDGGGGTGEGTIGLGTLGITGSGGSGGLLGSRRIVSRVRISVLSSGAGLSPEVSRRVIRRHVTELRFCYEQELASRPDLAGEVIVDVTISPTGAVVNAARSRATLSSEPAESCMVRATRRWAFPAPEGGAPVDMQYRIELSTAD